MKNAIKKIQETNKFKDIYNKQIFFLAQLFIAMFLYVLEFFFDKNKQNTKAIVSITTVLVAVYFFTLLVCFILVTVKDIQYTFTPILLLSMFLMKVSNYNANTLFIGALPAVLILIIFMVVKIFIFPIKFKPGKMLLPILLLGITVLFGGFGQVTVKQFFDLYNFIFIFSLSFIPTFAYIFIFNYLPKNQTKKENEKLIQYFMIVGFFTIFILLTHIIYEFAISTKKETINLENQFINKDFLGCSMVIIGIFPFYYAMKLKGLKAFMNFLYGNILFIGAIYTTSKSALFIGGIALFIMIILSIIYTTSSTRYIYMGFLVGILFTSMVVLLNSKSYITSYIDQISIMPSDFKKSCYKSGFRTLINFPLLGKGLQNITLSSYNTNPFLNLYIKGGNIIQFFGATGFIGIACILYLTIKKFTILVRDINKYTLIVLMSYTVFVFISFFTSLYFMFIPFVLFSIIITAYIESIDFTQYNQEDDKLLIYKEIV